MGENILHLHDAFAKLHPDREAEARAADIALKYTALQDALAASRKHQTPVEVKLRALLKEAVQALQDRARDAFDCGRGLSQDDLEAAWADEAPEDYAQFVRLWNGAQS